MIPRPAWLIAVFCGLFFVPAFAQRKQAPVGIVPPQPVQLNVKIRREGKTEIPLRIYGVANEPLQFLIRTPPAQGRLGEPRQTGRETAVAVYEPPTDLTVTADRFLYAVKSEAGVSAPVEVLITILDQPPQLTIPDGLEYPAVRTGTTTSKLLEISNSGGSLAIGEVIVDAPWRIEGKSEYRLATGDIAIFKITFAPAVGGTFEGVARFTSDPSHSTALRGIGETSIAANPAEVTLQSAAGDPVRRGTLELINQTDEPRELQFKADPRLLLPAKTALPSRGRVTISIETVPGDVRVLAGEIRIVAPDLEMRVAVKAAASGALVRARQSAISFGRIATGKTATAKFELENIGGTPGDVAWTVAPPFRTSQASVLLLPGDKRSFDIEIESKTPGRFRGWVQFKAGAQAFDLPLDAEVVGVGTAPLNGGAKAANTASSPGMPAGTGDSPAPSAEAPPAPPPPILPLDWVSDPVLPPGVKVSATTPTTATIEWPASLSPATNFRVDLRQFAYTADHQLTVKWLELEGLRTTREGDKYVATIRDLDSNQPWTVRVIPMIIGETPSRLFAIDFRTPPKVSFLPKLTVVPGMLAVLAVLIIWQLAGRWRRS